MSRPGPDFIIIGAMKSGTTTLSDPDAKIVKGWMPYDR